MIQALLLASTAVSAGASIIGGISASRTATFNAWQSEFAGRLEGFNIETERKISMAEASQRHNDRLDLYRENLSSNIAAFASAGRDIGGQDRSVSAFLQKQQEIAAGDTQRSDFMAQITSQRLQAERLSAIAEGAQRAAAMRAEGQAAAWAGVIGAFTTVAGGLYQYNLARYTAAPSVTPRTTSFVVSQASRSGF